MLAERCCLSGHTLISFATASDDYYCDKCHSDIPVAARLWGCRTCGFDLCDSATKHPNQPIQPPRIRGGLARRPARPAHHHHARQPVHRQAGHAVHGRQLRRDRARGPLHPRDHHAAGRRPHGLCVQPGGTSLRTWSTPSRPRPRPPPPPPPPPCHGATAVVTAATTLAARRSGPRSPPPAAAPARGTTGTIFLWRTRTRPRPSPRGTSSTPFATPSSRSGGRCWCCPRWRRPSR